MREASTGLLVELDPGSNVTDLLLEQHAKDPVHALYSRKGPSGWADVSAQQFLDQVRALAKGLIAGGLTPGETVAVMSGTRYEWTVVDFAIWFAGGVPVPIYETSSASQIEWILHDSGARRIFAENEAKAALVREVLDSSGLLGDSVLPVVRMDSDGAAPNLASLAAAGTGVGDAELERHRSAAGLADIASLVYTSGTTGRPKGVCQTHASFVASAHGGVATDRLGPGDDIMSYLPMAWVGDHLFSVAQWLVGGFTLNCPESAATVMNDMREIGPSYYFGPPRTFEGLLTAVSIRMEDAAAPKRWMYARCMALARRVGADLLNGAPVGALDRLKYRVGDLLVYGPLRNVLGMSRIRVAYTAGAAIGPDLFRFYRSIGVNLKQFYGQTETCAYVCLQRDGQVRLQTVGTAAPGIELKIAADGEVLVRGVSVLQGYHNRPDATAEVLDAEGYFHTGDAGVLDAEGHLRIIDRAKDVGRMAGGAMFAPNYIENKLKFFPQIKEAVCFGDGRGEVCAFVNIDFEAVGNWAERRGLAYGGYVDLAGKPEVLALVAECIGQVNADLATEPGMADTQVARFIVLHKELDPDDDELTRTRKVRRGFIAQKYAVLVDALYGGRTEQFIETQVKFEDGRTGTVSATLGVVEAKRFPAAAGVAA